MKYQQLLLFVSSTQKKETMSCCKKPCLPPLICATVISIPRRLREHSDPSLFVLEISALFKLKIFSQDFEESCFADSVRSKKSNLRVHLHSEVERLEQVVVLVLGVSEFSFVHSNNRRSDLIRFAEVEEVIGAARRGRVIWACL